MTKLDAFKVGDRVELLLFYSFHDDPLPQGTVIGVSSTHVSVKMDRNGKVVRFHPSDLRIIETR